MVVCNVEIPRPPALPNFIPVPPKLPNLIPPPPPKPPAVKKQQTKNIKNSSFRLVENQDENESIYSSCKQKIDSMFESDTSGGGVTENSVQAKIEKMFTDVAVDNGIPVNEIGCHVFSVDYLGSVPLQNKVTSLSGLQSPLAQLYFGYKRNLKQKKLLTGRLEISTGGLKVQYQGEKGDLEQQNPFPTIAVWSAVKFVLHDENKISYAFLPLITDPDNLEKQSLFRTLGTNEKKYIMLNSQHSPLFAVVMRRMGMHKQLECHGFVCQTSEDAIVIAATLYKSLMAHMKSKDKKPKNKNGVSCMSISSSAFNDSSGTAAPVRPPRRKKSTTSSVVSGKETTNDKQPLLPKPKRSPKKSIKTKKAPKAPPIKIDLDAILPWEDVCSTKANDDLSEMKAAKTMEEKWHTYMSVQQKQVNAEMQEVIRAGTTKSLKRTQSLRRRADEEGIMSKGAIDYSGDILTKVTIPRSGSFLNAGGLTKYKSKMSRNNGQTAGGSPLGFHELFNEFRLQEGLHSIDQILGVIIDPNGMSFNDLKPIYKEFLLKLAVTLTKDELYQRSKAIMRRRRKKMRHKSGNHRNSKRHSIVSHKLKGLKKFFRKRFRPKHERIITRSDDVFNTAPKKEDEKVPESSISTSSYDTRHFRPKSPAQNCVGPKTGNYKGVDRPSTSEESDFFSLRKNGGKHHIISNQNRNSSSGYVSCSECSYDSDSCTCVSADKCYCSLGGKQVIPKQHPKLKSVCHAACRMSDKCYCSLEPVQDTISWCACDTDSCTDSNKCYCLRGHQPSLMARHTKLAKMKSNSRSTRSLEYMHNPSECYYEKVLKCSTGGKRVSTDKLALDYDIFNDYRLSQSRDISKRAHSEISRRPSGYTSTNIRGFSSYRATTSAGGNRSNRTSITAGACTEALSVKKSAEIAALFADVRLSQTTDITHVLPKDTSHSNRRNHGLKYVPAKTYSRMHKSYTTHGENGHRMVHNTLYGSSVLAGNNMYSARNGLYTIQSQSDESRNSSYCGNIHKEKRNYFNVVDRHGEHRSKIIGNNLENSLGYLP